jgi:hypothetical protein
VDLGADTVPGDPTKTTVVTTPDARKSWAQCGGTHLEDPRRPRTGRLAGARETRRRRKAEARATRKVEEVERGANTARAVDERRRVKAHEPKPVSREATALSDRDPARAPVRAREQGREPVTTKVP